MNKEIYQVIKDSMIMGIIFYGVKFDNGEDRKKFIMTNKNLKNDISGEDIIALTGRLSREIYQFKTNNFPIRNVIRNEWKNKGYEREAEEAFKSIDPDEIVSQANLLGVDVETFDEIKHSYDEKKQKDARRKSRLSGNDIWVMLLWGVMFLIIIGMILRIFGFTESSYDKMNAVRYKACKDAGDMGDRWDCEEALKKAGLR
jgi:hypothetical protein